MQSAHKSAHNSFHIITGEVSHPDGDLDVPRRRWPADANAEVLSEALIPGVNLSAVARRHGLKPQQVFAWRRQALRSGAIDPLLPASDGPGFVSIAIERCGSVELVAAGVTIRAGRTCPGATGRGDPGGPLNMIPAGARVLVATNPVDIR